MSKTNKEILEKANAAIAEGDFEGFLALCTEDAAWTFEGDFVAALGEITLRDEAGEAVQHAYCDVWRFREGRMAELHAFVIKTGLEGGTPS